jgi:hypothetical protein
VTSELRRRKRAFANRQAKLALKAARAQGCVCDPEIMVSWNAGEVPLIDVAHDDWCPLLRVMQEREPAGRYQAVLDPGSPFEAAP